MSSPYFKSLVTLVVCCGTGWALYCLSPAGSAEREQTRQQTEYRRHSLERQMYRKPSEPEK